MVPDLCRKGCYCLGAAKQRFVRVLPLAAALTPPPRTRRYRPQTAPTVETVSPQSQGRKRHSFNTILISHSRILTPNPIPKVSNRRSRHRCLLPRSRRQYHRRRGRSSRLRNRHSSPRMNRDRKSSRRLYARGVRRRFSKHTALLPPHAALLPLSAPLVLAAIGWGPHAPIALGGRGDERHKKV